ncbi:MAG: 50S ribosomal protein L29 [bacterium]
MTKKTNNFKDTKPEELKKKLHELRESIRSIHFKAEGSKSKNVKEGKFLRKQVAQVLTEINKNNKNK